MVFGEHAVCWIGRLGIIPNVVLRCICRHESGTLLHILRDMPQDRFNKRLKLANLVKEQGFVTWTTDNTMTFIVSSISSIVSLRPGIYINNTQTSDATLSIAEVTVFIILSLNAKNG